MRTVEMGPRPPRQLMGLGVAEIDVTNGDGYLPHARGDSRLLNIKLTKLEDEEGAAAYSVWEPEWFQNPLILGPAAAAAGLLIGFLVGRAGR